MEDPTATEIDRSILSFTETETAVKCSAAFPTWLSAIICYEGPAAYDRKKNQSDPFSGERWVSLYQSIDT
jgi:hypothetical protein